MIYVLIRAINLFAQLISFALIAMCVMSFFVAYNPYSSAGRIYQFLAKITDPVVAPFRKLLMKFNTGPVDFSPMLAMIAIEIIARIIIRILIMFAL